MTAGKTTLDARTRAVLGILEHASRAALLLEALDSKSSWARIGRLAQAVRRCGKPRFLRTDNERVFTSGAFRFALFMLGIRQQRIDPLCPWQNGRAERFFGTLNRKLDCLAVGSVQALSRALVEFRFFRDRTGGLAALRSPGAVRVRLAAQALAPRRALACSEASGDLDTALPGAPVSLPRPAVLREGLVP